MDGETPDTLTAVRSIYDSAEIIFKIMFGVNRLSSNEINSKILDRLKKNHTGNTLAAGKMLTQSFGKWVDALHNYRHLEGSEKVSAPPIEFAVAFISAGAGHIRWLLSLEQVL